MIINSRSLNMSKIRSRDTKPEKTLRSALFKKGFRFRLHPKKLSGRPDIVLPKYNIAIFVHGCFWHQHENCKYRFVPKTRQDYWIPKLLANVARDKKNIHDLTSKGWRVFVVWECEIRKNADDAVTEIVATI